MARKELSENSDHRRINRRDFMVGAGGAAISLSAINGSLFAAGNDKIKLGMIGCGGRGNWLGDLFIEHGGYEIVAGADYFEDKADTFGGKFGVAESKRFTGLSGYKKLLELNLDAVVIVSPPYFHPEHAAAAVDAGKHVYQAKPIAVDVPGCDLIAHSGKKASEKKQCFLVDFQTRADPLFIEAVKRVHQGGIGKIAYGQCSYHGDRLSVKAKPGTIEARLRNWVFDKRLSGDIITEQNIHALDVASWIMNTDPVSGTGTGGRKVRTNVGDCWDHFALIVQYPDNVGVTFSSRQFGAHGTPGGIKNVFYGSEGTIETEYGGRVLVRGKSFYRGGKTSQIYKEGAVRNIVNFYDNISSGKFDNLTVKPSVQSNKITIMGRTAAYENRTVTWKETVNNKDVINAEIKGLKA